MSNNWKFNKRRDFLLGLAGITGMVALGKGQSIYLNYSIQSLDNQARTFYVYGEKSLKERAATKGLIYGAAASHDNLISDSEFAKVFIQQSGMMVPELEFKWSSGNKRLRPDQNSFDFKAADWMIEFSQKNDLLFRGHTLVWHHALPNWFEEQVNRQNAELLLTKHIQTVVGRYVGKVHSWDVVNEAIAPSHNIFNGLRKTPWLDLLGTDYIDLAFRLAAQADPSALLVYNDFGLDYDNSKDEAKRQAVLSLLEGLKSKGTPIHALGIQAHLSGDSHSFNPQKFRDFLSNVASLDLKILITEMDVKDQNLPFDTAMRDRTIAAAYEDYLSVALDEKAVIAVLTWGLSDKYTWLNEFQPRKDKTPVRPLPLDAQMQYKLAWNAIARAFDHAPKR
ncbi:endo-1,4-beta-xylanase [Anabaena lutea]|uniref:Beta-xylanase n=1 Tax=Anabaena lutea FACHB-196 TaxID=2692881 RepID=A0ABR8FEU4_9NOST|nr:endo-1,4-beta-xylanase [Anabaena lutea]MBD2567385.1 endo-1,4-beta-xylanase [Anabaena lutea FACHB-196]